MASSCPVTFQSANRFHPLGKCTCLLLITVSLKYALSACHSTYYLVRILRIWWAVGEKYPQYYVSTVLRSGEETFCSYSKKTLPCQLMCPSPERCCLLSEKCGAKRTQKNLDHPVIVNTLYQEEVSSTTLFTFLYTLLIYSTIHV